MWTWWKQSNRSSQKAYADFINEMPEGYDTLIGERGVKLSGGQKLPATIAGLFIKILTAYFRRNTSALDWNLNELFKKHWKI